MVKVYTMGEAITNYGAFQTEIDLFLGKTCELSKHLPKNLSDYSYIYLYGRCCSSSGWYRCICNIQ